MLLDVLASLLHSALKWPSNTSELYRIILSQTNRIDALWLYSNGHYSKKKTKSIVLRLIQRLNGDHRLNRFNPKIAQNLSLYDDKKSKLKKMLLKRISSIHNVLPFWNWIATSQDSKMTRTNCLLTGSRKQNLDPTLNQLRRSTGENQTKKRIPIIFCCRTF